jgi:cysteine-S-conjugate beta-lyase
MKKNCSHTHPETALVHACRETAGQAQIVNPPLYRASTILFPNVAALEQASWVRDPYYGRHGHQPVFEFERAMAALEGGYGSVAVESGVGALTTAMAAFVKAGDHILVVDSVYSPTRIFCDNFLKNFGVETDYYPAGVDITPYLRSNTRVVYAESPGSLTFELQDVGALAKAAATVGAKVIVDNTWATPLYFKPFEHGAAVSVHAATKYVVGHSDAILGVMTARDEESYQAIKKMAALLGRHAAPDTVWLAQRGLRTMAVRLKQHFESALALCDWWLQQPETERIFFPPHLSDPYHALWKRDFKGGCGLFGVLLKEPYTYRDAAHIIDHLKLFGIGYSWGGFESLALPIDLKGVRSHGMDKNAGRAILRLHAGLEHMDDLRKDLAQAVEAWRTEDRRGETAVVK